MSITVNAHITGTVWKITVKVGDVVAEGDTVAILESMKMEMPVESPAAGKVAAVLAKEGGSIEEGAPLLELRAGLERARAGLELDRHGLPPPGVSPVERQASRIKLLRPPRRASTRGRPPSTRRGRPPAKAPAVRADRP